MILRISMAYLTDLTQKFIYLTARLKIINNSIVFDKFGLKIKILKIRFVRGFMPFISHNQEQIET
jgi:hypothetical protein